MMNPLCQLQQHGQSVWLDYIDRRLLTSGELLRLITEDGLRGMTSNPAIFEKAITSSDDYRDLLDAAELQHLSPAALYEHIAVRDICAACDLLRPIHEQTGGRDGLVSLEVSPKLAHNAEGTVAEARRLWKEVDRPNLMIKVPGTAAALPAIEQLLSEGINVNITLLFSQAVYEQVAEIYLAALEKRLAAGKDVRRVASVASFFVSRIDTLTDQIITERLSSAAGSADAALMRNLAGKTAIANARLAYQRYLRIFSSSRWRAVAERGGQTQRLLWASTSTKNPNYRDVLYVEELIGRDTVNTMPPATLHAFRDHGRVRDSLTEDVDAARQHLETLAQVRISLRQITDKLLVDGIQLFADAFDQLLDAIARRRKART